MAPPKSGSPKHAKKATVILSSGREKSLQRRHPWIFSGAIRKIEGSPAPGETVTIIGSDGSVLGKGAFSPVSKIRVRVWSFQTEDEITPEFFRCRLERAVAARVWMLNGGHTACRLVYSESDGLPGLIIDKYGEYVVCQFLTTGVEYWKPTIVSLIAELVPNRGIFERSDSDVRKMEGLDEKSGVLYGEAPPEFVEIIENECLYLVDVRKGHKTGFYLDQRVNRPAVANFAAGMEVLNCFSYTGGFSVASLKAGADRVINIDASADALDLARRIGEINSISSGKADYLVGDVFSILRDYREKGRRFDLIILDPPKFAESRQHLEKACRGYKDINLLAFRLLRAGGMLATFSCSGLITPDLFEKTIAWAALDAGREGRILKHLEASPDHPVTLNFPEAAYLKGLICTAE